MGRSQVLFNRSKQRFKEQAKSSAGRGNGTVDHSPSANASGAAAVDVQGGGSSTPKSKGSTSSSKRRGEGASHRSSTKSQHSPHLQVNAPPQPPSASSSYAAREMAPTPTTSNRQNGSPNNKKELKAMKHKQAYTKAQEEHELSEHELLSQEQQWLLEEERIRRLRQRQEQQQGEQQPQEQNWEVDSRRFQEHLLWQEQEQLEKLMFLEQRQLEVKKQQHELRQKKLQDEQQQAMRLQQQQARQRQEQVRQLQVSRQGQLWEREQRLQDREQQLLETYGQTATNQHATTNPRLLLNGGQRKSKTPRWQRQQQLLQQLDEEESLYELGKTIIQPMSKRDDTTISKGCSSDSLEEITEVKLDVGAVADALALLGFATRLRIPDHLAETLQTFSDVPRQPRQLMVHQSIAERRENERHRAAAQDWTCQNSVSSARRKTPTTQFHHRLKGRIMRGVSSSMSTCSKSLPSVQPKSTMTSHHGEPSAVISALSAVQGQQIAAVNTHEASLHEDDQVAPESNLSPRESVNLNLSADTEDTNYLSVEEVSTIGFDTIATPQSTAIMHSFKGPILPVDEDTDPEGMSYPSLRPTDAFTINSRMQQLLLQRQQDDAYDNGPGELLMTYTVTEEGSSVDDSEMSAPASHNTYDLTGKTRFEQDEFYGSRETREIISLESDAPRGVDDYRSPANINSQGRRMDKYASHEAESAISALDHEGVDDVSNFTARTPDDYRSPKNMNSIPARRDFAENPLFGGRERQGFVDTNRRALGNFDDYEDDRSFSPEKGAFMESMVSPELASVMDSTLTYDPALIDLTDALFPEIQAAGENLAASTSMATTINTKAIRTAYASMTGALRASARSSTPRANTVSAAAMFKRQEEDEDLDDWLESAMATKSEENPSEGPGTNTEEDLDAWLDDVICR